MSDEAAVARFQTLLRIPTESRHDLDRVQWDQFDRFAQTLIRLYPLVHRHLDREVVAGHSLLYRWPGARSTEPAVLMAHYDVVPATDVGWRHPPFAGELSGSGDEKLIWGRGTLDDKGSAAAILEAVEAQLAAGITPHQDVYLFFGHDEETHGSGAIAAVELLRARGVRPTLVLDEGGAIARDAFPAVDAPVAFVGAGEKAPNTVRLIVDQPGGHASTPPRETSTTRLARAILKLNAKPFPSTLNPILLALLQTIGQHASGGLGFAARNARWLSPVVRPMLERVSPEVNAMMRTTQAVTMLDAGSAPNALAERASAVVNLRVSVDSTVDEALDHLRKAIDDETVRVEVEHRSDPAPVSPLTGLAWELVAASIEKSFPGTVVAPYIQTGATDSRHFTRISSGVYRFTPFEVTREQRDALHARNERLHVSAWLRGIEFYRSLLAAL
jgi:carboxypeptidase PM20D1